MSLSQLIYVSELAPEGFPSNRPVGNELQRILETARVRNEQVSVTGILLFSGGHFLQVIEGHELVLERMFQRIAADPRHKNVERLAFLSITHRMFDRWQMGLLNLDEHLELDHGIFEQFKQDVQFALSDDAARRSVVSLLSRFKDHLEAESPAAAMA
ncbi:MAG: BLUF domain-containing protein [Pirellulaceae bacterium]